MAMPSTGAHPTLSPYKRRKTPHELLVDEIGANLTLSPYKRRKTPHELLVAEGAYNNIVQYKQLPTWLL